jgi:tetratricopeptide (TPR) repeat protein
MQQRVADALVDLEEARAIAIELADGELEVEVMLEQATALDFHEEFARSTALGEEAAARLRTDPARYGARELAIRFAAARTLFRAEKFADAEAPLRALLSDARAANHTAIVIEASGLLVPTLAMVGKLDDAEALSAELIELTSREGDRFHLCAAYINRTWVWSVRGDVARVAEDLRIVIQLAREGGQAHLERAATYNLAQDLLWQGSLDEAQRLALRCLALQTHHGEGTTRLERVLLARIAAARGEATNGLGAISDLTDDERLMARVLDSLASETADWEALVTALDPLPPTSRLEMWALLAAAGRLSPPVLARARELALADPIWARRVNEFDVPS